VSARRRRRGAGERGQGLVEFSLAITIFLLLVMGVVDLGRAVYQLNGVAQAARELARVTSVHPGSTLGGSAETSAALGNQEALVPNLGTPVYSCVDIANNAVTGACRAGDWVRVSIQTTFIPATPLAAMLGEIVLSGTASAKIE
jgi:Flp pilus assembly protein TadG